jgi:hypothetical protein
MMTSCTTPKSIIQGIHWPAIPGNAAASMLAIQYQLEQSQWWKPEQLLKQQLAQLSPLVTHAAQTVIFTVIIIKTQGIPRLQH